MQAERSAALLSNSFGTCLLRQIKDAPPRGFQIDDQGAF